MCSFVTAALSLTMGFLWHEDFAVKLLPFGKVQVSFPLVVDPFVQGVLSHSQWSCSMCHLLPDSLGWGSQCTSKCVSCIECRIVHEAAQNTPNHITRSHSDDTSARHMHNMRWIEMIGINVGNGQEVCCDGLDTLESAVCKVAIMTFCHCNCGIHRRVGFFHRAGCSCSLEGTGYYLTTVPHISRSL